MKPASGPTPAPLPSRTTPPEPLAGTATTALLQRFGEELQQRLCAPRLLALWAHGSLGGGDYQEGRSDLDLIAITDRRCTPEEERRLGELHENLDSTERLAAKLHCSYLAADEVTDPERSHLTWAHRELKRRPVTPVTRRELHTFGRVLHGADPAALLPPVTDAQLATSVLASLRGFWRPALDQPDRWLQDIWVDLGLLTLARATVTLRDGRLITKGEALHVLAELNAPAEVVADIRARRYDVPAPAPAGPAWLARRADLARDFLGHAIDRTWATYGPGGPADTAFPGEGAE
ncbi:nucleotidyltransferase [Streptomyces sp. x-80]|uniref:nucleotidyltransferase domain-containing protein n=1 Tax=Streptomyces sp. x-80 TaxID=2789282 RepID=UPI003980F7F1